MGVVLGLRFDFAELDRAVFISAFCFLFSVLFVIRRILCRFPGNWFPRRNC